MAEPTLLEVEAVRAMSGRPAWRVIAACVKHGPCPRCGALAGVKCRVQHIERVWAQRARERGAAKPKREHAAGAQAFIDVVIRERVAEGARLWRRPDAEGWHWPDECGAGAGAGDVEPAAMDAAVALGYVRLAISGGIMPVWVVTDTAVREAATLAAEVIAAHEAEQQATQPSALVIDAEAAVANFAARIGEG